METFYEVNDDFEFVPREEDFIPYDWEKNATFEQIYASMPDRQDKLDEIRFNSLYERDEKKEKFERKIKTITKDTSIKILKAGTTTLIGLALILNINKAITNNKNFETSMAEIPSYVVEYGNYDVQTKSYDTFVIAVRILDYHGPQSLDSIIYKAYNEFKGDSEKEMNMLFQQFQAIFEKYPEHFSTDIKNNLNFNSFNAYVESKGFKSIKEYDHAMKKLLIAYAEVNEASKQYDDKVTKLNTLEDNLNPGGRR